MAEADDFYKILGVQRNASQADIQKAYRDLAKKHHPDRNPGDKSAVKKFQKIQRAFEILNDPEKREMYDRYGSSFEARTAGGPQGARTYTWTSGPGAGGFNFEDVDFGQFFGERFGAEAGAGFENILRNFARGSERGRKSAGRRMRGADLEHEIQVPFTVALTGGSIELTIEGLSERSQTLAVKIPPGIEDGKKIRLRGQGQPGPGGGPPGDLLLLVRVEPHPHFERHGDNLTVRVPVTLPEAVAGAKVDVPTPKGTVTLRVPPGTSSGTKLRIKGHGVPKKGNTAGDLLAEIQIMLPKEIDEATQKAVSHLNLRYAGDPRANLRW